MVLKSPLEEKKIKSSTICYAALQVSRAGCTDMAVVTTSQLQRLPAVFVFHLNHTCPPSWF